MRCNGTNKTLEMLGLIKEFSPTLNEDDGLCLYISHAMFLIEFFILTKSNIIKILFFNLFCRKVLRETTLNSLSFIES